MSGYLDDLKPDPPQPEFTIRNVIDRGMVVGVAGCDVVMRVDSFGVLTVRVLAYDEERVPNVSREPCWPTEAIAHDPQGS